MTDPIDELDPITAELRNEGDRLRRLTTKLVLIPIVAGVLVVAGSYWVIGTARARLAGVEADLADVRVDLTAATEAKEELDEQIAQLEKLKAELADEVEARRALFERYEDRLPREAALLDEGLTAAKAGDYQRALATYGRVLEDNPGNELALKLQGTTQSKAGRSDAAVQSLERAASLYPDDAEAWYQLGYALWENGDRDRAVGALERSFELEPKNLERARRDPAYKPLRDYKETLAGSRAAARPDERELIRKAIAAADRGDFDQAIAGYRKALASNPANPVVLDHLGYSYYRAERYDDAIAVLRRAIELDPTRAEPSYHLGLTLWRQGDREAAANAIDQAFRVDPTYEQHAKTDPQYRELRAFRARRNGS